VIEDHQLPDDDCTSGFTVKRSGGTRFMVTAGHCFTLGESIRGGTGIDWGTVTDRAGFPAKDMELIGGTTYSGFIYVGDHVGTGVDIEGAGDPLVSANYCVSGFEADESCGHEALALNAQACGEAGCTNNLVRATDEVTDVGDSGAPFYFKTNGHYYLRGLYIGFSAANGVLYAHKWSTVRDTFDVTIVTGS
jgi:hypothetical protein